MKRARGGSWIDRLHGPRTLDARRRAQRSMIAVLACLLVMSMLAAATSGALNLGVGQVVGVLLDRLGVASPWPFEERDAAVLLNLRFPRVLLSALIGATLAVSGAAMQGLFRNPLADPALLGVSSGASLGAVVAIAAGAALTSPFPAFVRPWITPLVAFAAGLLATSISVRVARVDGRTRTALMLLSGIAVSALSGAGIGAAMQLATDAQLRNIMFWTLGSVGGATWSVLGLVGPLLVVSVLGLLRVARALNALLLGEREAAHLGISTERVRLVVVVLTALGVGAAVSVCGVIGFVGLVVPHVARLVLGADHRRLLPASALLGATLLTLADLVARTVVAPAELPVGVVTAVLGGPLFLWQIARDRDAAVLR